MERLAKKHPEIEEVWLFGSLARGEAVPGSDMVIEHAQTRERDKFDKTLTHFKSWKNLRYQKGEGLAPDSPTLETGHACGRHL
jgi:predicted nucleotidyltransferase